MAETNISLTATSPSTKTLPAIDAKRKGAKNFEMELINQIHKYLIGIAIIAAFIHFVYLFIKASKKQPLLEDFTAKEYKRVAEEYIKNYPKYSKIYLKPLLIFLLWTFCICAYFILAGKFGILW